MTVQHGKDSYWRAKTATGAVAHDASQFSMFRIAATVTGIAVVYLGLGLAIIVLHSGPVSISDDLSLLNGSITALALYAVFFQVAQARREGADRAAANMREAALRADQLHAEYNSREMQTPRVIAYAYLKFLKQDPALLAEFARNWVLDEDNDCRVPNGSKLTFNEYGGALDAMIAFFVRVSSHVRAHESRLASGASDRHQMIGSFFWSYWWRAGMEELIAACKQVHAEPGNAGEYDQPYFVDALTWLQGYYERHRAPATNGANSDPAGGNPSVPVSRVQSSAPASLVAAEPGTAGV